MGTIQVKGLDAVSLMLDRFEDDTEAIVKVGLYEGAGILADAVKSEIEALPTDKGPITDSHPIMSGPTQVQKDGLLSGFGISRFRRDGDVINVSIGFDGYNDFKTSHYPQGQPNVLVARSINSGTSYMAKNPFVKRAINKAKDKAVEAVQERIRKAAREIAERK